LAIAWNEDRPEDLVLIQRNLAEVLLEISSGARARRHPAVAMAQSWHRRIYDGATLPVRYFAGEIRDDDPQYPELIGYEVAVGPARGVPAVQVPAELALFESSMQAAVRNLDDLIPIGSKPAERTELDSVLTLCALAHGEWVRIHPFANGNGRTARLWANWSAVRYGLPPFVRLMPRPSGVVYAQAAARSMRGDHIPMVQALSDMLEVYF
jgi:fido (protein-threonine AMPylation protein)